MQNAVFGGIIGGHKPQAIKIQDRARKTLPGGQVGRLGRNTAAGRAGDSGAEKPQAGGRGPAGRRHGQQGRQVWRIGGRCAA